MFDILMALGFIESKLDSNLYFNIEGRRPVMLLLYVDELFLIEKVELIKSCKKETCFRVRDERLGYGNYFIGMEVWQNTDRISLDKGSMQWGS